MDVNIVLMWKEHVNIDGHEFWHVLLFGSIMLVICWLLGLCSRTRPSWYQQHVLSYLTGKKFSDRLTDNFHVHFAVIQNFIILPWMELVSVSNQSQYRSCVGVVYYRFLRNIILQSHSIYPHFHKTGSLDSKHYCCRMWKVG